MTTPSSPSAGTPPPAAPPPRKGPPKALFIGLGTVLVGALVAGGFFLGRRSTSTVGDSGPTGPLSSGKGASEAGASVEGLPEPTESEMEVPGSSAPPAFWVDVLRPRKVRGALASNAWLKAQLDQPLGKGFVGGWAAFLGSTGEDLKGNFKGAVLDLVAGQLLDTPFRVVWFAGDARASTPAVIVPAPPGAATSAYDALDAVASRSTLKAKSCPSTGTAGATPPEDGFALKRWLVAEQTLWAGRTADRLVLARHPLAVLQGLCTELTGLKPQSDTVDVELTFQPDANGREAQLFSYVLGLEPGARLQFGVEGDKLVGRGIAGQLQEGVARLDTAPLSDDLLKLVPEDTPVVLALQLKLPETLNTETLKAYWQPGGEKAATRTRQIAVAWTPRGDPALAPELAVLWGRVEDAPALQELFSGGSHTVTQDTACNHVVLASSAAELERMRGACAGKVPNLLNAAGPVVAGWRAPGSVTFGVNTGRLLSGLTMDGFLSESRVGRNAPMPKAAPPEIEAARRELESLPYLGLRGTVQDESLVPGGFGS
ncbi:hypothetical protein LZ198_19430 [Myxococcus sp. K15C18031901]|uniref:hypothetical protein n=1 Tax=Myxococcus dinghuensis TaxID=2906761 RepID=UPI0020A73B83|nr:hypothetical protein [Myxococcus dinghuensis]MCP3101051.1 hypothetical protein [Myxococcus dinghuensis]